jgi:hypothetical protein
MAELIEAQAFTRTLTGFDEIAIAVRFHAPLGDLQGGLIARALLFIAEKRAGKSDLDAYQAVMDMALGEVEDHFETHEDADLGKAPGKSGTDAGPTS